MTPALKAMVEAMAKEISRQVFLQMDTGPGAYPEVEVEDGGRMIVFHNTGSFNLEKVARAGLAAIPATALASGIAGAFYEAGGYGDNGGWELPSPDAALEAMLDAILKETP